MLISYLSARTITLPFKDVEELMLKSNDKIFVQPYSAQMDSFRYSSVPIFQRVYTERIEPNLPFYVDFLGRPGEYFLFSMILDKCYHNQKQFLQEVSNNLTCLLNMMIILYL